MTHDAPKPPIDFGRKALPPVLGLRPLRDKQANRTLEELSPEAAYESAAMAPALAKGPTL